MTDHTDCARRDRRAALEPQDAPAAAGVEIPAGYTPGPWQVEEGTALVWGGGDADDQTSRGMGIPVAEAKGYEQRYWGRQIDWEERAANARLIALAPAMAEELVALRAENARLREDRLAAFDTCIKEAADLRNTQYPGQLSWWACNELLGRFHAARGKIAPAALTQETKP